jgi:hypothetical protein
MVVLVLSFGVHSMAWMDNVMHYTMQDRRKGVKTSKQDTQSCNVYYPGYEGNLNLMPITSPARGGILLLALQEQSYSCLCCENNIAQKSRTSASMKVTHVSQSAS